MTQLNTITLQSMIDEIEMRSEARDLTDKEQGAAEVICRRKLENEGMDFEAAIEEALAEATESDQT